MSSSSRSRRALSALFIIAAAAAQLRAQTADDLGTIAIAVVVPRSNTMLSTEQKNQLGNTLLQAATATGVSAMGGVNGFELTPMVTVTKEGEAGDLQKLKYVTLNVMLAVKQSPGNTAFASTSLSVTGNGATRDAALTEAINNISPTDERITKLVESAKPRIIQYYESSCSAIRSDAKARAGTGHTDEAIALLLTVPREATTCQTAASKDAEALYVGWRDAVCDGLVREARGALSARDFPRTIETIDKVDPASKCTKSADGVLKELERKVTSDHEFSLKVRAAITNREKVETSLSSPGAAAKQTHERTVGVALDVVAKLPTKPHVIDHH